MGTPPFAKLRFAGILSRMRSRYNIFEPGSYFMTATIVEWLPVFYGAEPCGIIVDSLNFCRTN